MVLGHPSRSPRRAASGAKRSGIRPGDILEVFEVELREDDDGLDHDDTFRPDALDGASWESPPETWPTAPAIDHGPTSIGPPRRRWRNL